MTAPGSWPATSDPLEAVIVARLRALAEQTLAELVQRAVAEALARSGAPAAPDRREWLTQPQAATVAGVSRSTLRAWQAAGRLQRGERGRVNAAELRALLAGRPATARGDVLELRQQRIADRLRGRP